MRYVFVGNRRFVLEEMMSQDLQLVDVFVIAGSHLERDIDNLNLDSYKIVHSKKELLDHLESINYDILISNGCPFILPVAKMKKAKYINIHPSYLPDLRGVDPVVGAMLFNKDFGATCHEMDQGIDTGDIIEKIRIPFTNDLDVALAYQLSFHAEKQVFNLALNSGFNAQETQLEKGDEIYYNRSVEDQTLDFSESATEIQNKVRAFGNLSQGVHFTLNGNKYTCHNSAVIDNPYIHIMYSENEEMSVLLVFEDSIIIKLKEDIVRLSRVKGNLSRISPGLKLNEKNAI